MAKKSRPKKSASKVSKAKAPKSKMGGAVGLAVSGAKAVGGLMGIGGKSKGTGKRSKKRSALWYAKEVQRLRLKRKWQKEKMRL